MKKMQAKIQKVLEVVGGRHPDDLVSDYVKGHRTQNLDEIISEILDGIPANFVKSWNKKSQ